MFTSLEIQYLLVAEAAVVVLGLMVFFGHALEFQLEKVWSAPLLAAGRNAMARLVEHAGEAYDQEEEDARAIEGLARRLQIHLFLELAPSLAGSSRDRLVELARAIGLRDSAERNCSSRIWSRRLHASRLLTLLGGGEHAVPPLFSDPEPLVRAQAAEWAADHPSPENLRRVLALLGDDSGICRFQAEDTLLEVGSEAVPVLAAFLQESLAPEAPAPAATDGSKTAHATDGSKSAHATDGSKAPELAAHAGDAAHATPALRGALKVAVGLGDTRFAGVALDLSRHPDGAVRQQAAALLGAVGGEEAVERLVALLDDGDALVRAASARSLGRLDHWAVAPRLANLLGDPSWSVRREAAVALGSFGAVGELYLRQSLGRRDRFAVDMARQVLELPAVVRSAVSHGC